LKTIARRHSSPSSAILVAPGRPTYPNSSPTSPPSTPGASMAATCARLRTVCELAATLAMADGVKGPETWALR
jgi:hypothetical protein